MSPLKLQVLGMSVIVSGKNSQINCVTLDTEMDFAKVNNILLSQSVPLLSVPGWQYLNVVLFATEISTETPLIFGYLYKTKLRHAKGKNNLKHWQFTNKQGRSASHVVSNFKQI